MCVSRRELFVAYRHDDLEALVHLANDVFDGDLDVLKCNVCCSTAPNTLAVHLPCRYAAGAALDKE